MPDAWVRLGRLMRLIRRTADVSLRDLERESSWRRSHLSEVERGRRSPSEELVRYYAHRFGDDGSLQLLFESVVHDRQRRRAQQRVATFGVRPAPEDGMPEVTDELSPFAVDTDQSEFVADITIPDGTVLPLGAEVEKVWRIKNTGTEVWRNRWLTRLGPAAGNAIPDSPRRVPVPETGPGQEVDLTVRLRVQRVPSTAEIYFKMTDEHGRVFFPQYLFGVMTTITAR